MSFMGNNFGRFARDVTRMEIASSETKLRETNPEQAREDHAGRISAHLLMLVVLLVLLILLGRGLFSGSTEQEKQDFFYQYTEEMMTACKPEYFLYEELSDPVVLMENGIWHAFAGQTDDPRAAAASWLGEGCTVQSWDDLVAAERERLWNEWYYGTEDITADNFIRREVNRHCSDQSLPALGENSWLVTDTAGEQHILLRSGKGWAICPLADLQ